MYDNGICITWNCGFFSCCSQRLSKIIQYANSNQKFPDYVDSSRQFGLYKPEDPAEKTNIDITHRFFHYQQTAPKFCQQIIFTDQFTDYKQINYELTNPIIQSYFSPSSEVIDRIKLYEHKYQFNYENTCGIFYRGNDKSKECGLAPYEEYAQKALEIRYRNPEIRFFIQTDDSLFVEYFNNRFYNCFDIKELPKIHDKDSAVTYKLNREDRLSHAIDLVSIVNILAKCKTLIVHSGNCAYWAVLYRGKPDGIIQHFTNEQRNQDKWI